MDDPPLDAPTCRSKSPTSASKLPVLNSKYSTPSPRSSLAFSGPNSFQFTAARARCFVDVSAPRIEPTTWGTCSVYESIEVSWSPPASEFLSRPCSPPTPVNRPLFRGAQKSGESSNQKSWLPAITKRFPEVAGQDLSQLPKPRRVFSACPADPWEPCHKGAIDVRLLLFFGGKGGMLCNTL